MTGTGSHVFLGGKTADQVEKKRSRAHTTGSHVIWKEKPLTSGKKGIAGSWNRKSLVLGRETADQSKKRSWAHGTGSHVIWKEKPLSSRNNRSWAQDGQKPRRKRGLKVQSPFFASGVVL